MYGSTGKPLRYWLPVISAAAIIILSLSINASAVGTLVRLSSATAGGSWADMAHGVVVDGSGNVYVAGEDDDSDAQYSRTIKYDNDLGFITEDSTEAYNRDSYGMSTTVDKDGNIIVAGYTNSGTDNDWFVLKYNSSLDTVLAKDDYVNGGSTGEDDDANDVVTDSSGNIFVTGCRWGGATPYRDYYTVKYNSNLLVQSSATYNRRANSNDIAYGIALDSDENVYVTGIINDGSDDNTMTVKYNCNTMEVVSSATLRAEQIQNGTDYIDYDCRMRDIEIDDSDNIFVTGYTTDSDGVRISLVTVKYDSNFVVVSSAVVKGVDDTIYYYGYGLDIDLQGNIIVGGTRDDNGTKSCLVIKYSNDLVLLSSATFSDTFHKEVLGVTVDDTGNIYAVGYSSSVSENNNYLVIKYNGLPVISSISPATASRGDTLDVTVTGHNFLSGLTGLFSAAGITVNTVNRTGPTTAVLNITVAADAATGKRNLTLTNTDGAYCTKTDVFNIPAPPDPEPDVVETSGEIITVGSSERKGIINPDKGDALTVYFKGTAAGRYTLKIFTLIGELVYSETKDSLAGGTFSWIPEDIASGIYVVHVNGPGVNISKKIAILR
ncbi:MAG: hypothetical protein ABIH89_02605 [Elusimicrobiota bacterium]